MKQNKNFKLTTPVLFLVFNRLGTTKRVFEEIKKAKPKELFIAADGPRNEEEKKKTDAVRDYVKKNINWKCKTKFLFREKNLGCKYAVSGAIDWFFKNVEQGIILEDDVLPNQSFFRFCQEMLERYKDNKRIMHLSGTNVEGISKIKEDYFFSNTFNVWGWATWRRAWKHYDVEMRDWEKWRIKCFSFMKDYSLITKLKSWRIYELTSRNKINTWDYQWAFAIVRKKKLSIIPKKNLITNVGVGGGTHTKNYGDEKSFAQHELNFPLKPKELVEENKEYFARYMKTYMPNFFKKSVEVLNYYFKKIFS